jgi:hypothetical protein
MYQLASTITRLPPPAAITMPMTQTEYLNLKQPSHHLLIRLLERVFLPKPMYLFPYNRVDRREFQHKEQKSQLANLHHYSEYRIDQEAGKDSSFQSNSFCQVSTRD